MQREILEEILRGVEKKQYYLRFKFSIHMYISISSSNLYSSMYCNNLSTILHQDLQNCLLSRENYHFHIEIKLAFRFKCALGIATVHLDYFPPSCVYLSVVPVVLSCKLPITYAHNSVSLCVSALDPSSSIGSNGN